MTKQLEQLSDWKAIVEIGFKRGWIRHLTGDEERQIALRVNHQVRDSKGKLVDCPLTVPKFDFFTAGKVIGWNPPPFTANVE